MKKILLLKLCVALASLSIGQTQSELNANAKEKYDATDKELNQVYNSILKEYKSDTVFIKNLKKSQKLWIQFRDSEMQVKYPSREPGYYGSVHPMCWSMYKEELTRERIKKLKIWLDGIEEGDVCSGSVKTKDQ